MCEAYDVDNDAWIQKQGIRYEITYMGSSMLSETEWWMTGGLFGFDDILNATFIYHTDTDTLDEFVTLPRPLWEHNLIRLDSNTFLFIGGSDDAAEQAWLFTLESQTFNKLDTEDISPFPISLAFGGQVVKADGTKEVVVTGGYRDPTTTYIYNVDSGEWRQGPDFPIDLYHGASAPYGNTFLAVGGYSSSTYERSPLIYLFEPDEEAWLLQPHVLTTPRYGLAAILVPPGYVECF